MTKQASDNYWKTQLEQADVYGRAERNLGPRFWLGRWASMLIRRILRLDVHKEDMR